MTWHCGSTGGQASIAVATVKPITFSAKDHGADACADLAPTLRAMGHANSHANGGGQMAVAIYGRVPDGSAQVVGALACNTGPNGHDAGNFACNQAVDAGHVLPVMVQAATYTTKLHNTKSNNAGKLFEERTTALDANSPPPALLTSSQVRRLLPEECESLMGFPRKYTAIPWRGKTAIECPDGPRYRALGNSWAVPVVAWIGKRIAGASA